MGPAPSSHVTGVKANMLLLLAIIKNVHPLLWISAKFVKNHIFRCFIIVQNSSTESKALTHTEEVFMTCFIIAFLQKIHFN
jgi:hypothetical protein